MKFMPLLVLLCLLFATVGCGPNTVQTSTLPALPSLEPTVTATLPPTETSAPTAESTPVICPVDPTSTPIIPTSTNIPKFYPPTPVPAPLSPEGPWLLLSKGTFYNGPRGIIDPILTNADGSAWEPLNVPRPADAGQDEYHWWYAEQIPNKPLIVIRGYMSEYFPDLACGKDHLSPAIVNPYNDLLSIIQFPDNKIIRQFTLLGAAAKTQIRKDDCALKELDGIPAVLGVTRLEGKHLWLRNDHDLVFPAAPDGPAADLYVYDFDTGNNLRLTSRQNNPDIIDLSPDGQTIIYQGVNKIDWYHEQVIESSGLYAVSLSGTDRLLFKPEYVPWGIEWLSLSQFLITDGFCDYWGTGECAANLRFVDLSTGTSKVLYKNSKTWFSFVTDPIHHVLLLINPPADMPGAAVGKPDLNNLGEDTGRVEGIFQYDFTSRTLQPVMLENLPDSIAWGQEDQAFRLSYYHHDEQGLNSTSLKLMRFKSRQNFQLEERGSISNRDWISNSPDQRWRLGTFGEENYIIDQKGRPVQMVMDGSGYWSPDSSTLIQIVPVDEPQETQFLVYSRDRGWQNTLTRYLIDGYQWWAMWIKP